MPESPLTPDRRRISPSEVPIEPPSRAPFVELGLVSCFSFLRGASDAVDLVLAARALGYDALGIADVNSMAGVVRVHTEAKKLRLRPVIGCRIETVEGLAFLAYPRDRAAYGSLCRLISAGRMGTLDGGWQEKGVCQIDLTMLAAHSEGVQLILLPPEDLDAELTIRVESNVIPFRRSGPSTGSGDPGPLASGSDLEANSAGFRRDDMIWRTAPFAQLLPHLTRQLPTLRHLAAAYLHVGDDIARIERLDMLARDNGLTLLATNDVLYHAPDRRPLQDVMTAIRHKTTVAEAGHLLQPNAERHLKSPAEMAALFVRWPHAIAAARKVADACRFSLDHLRYEYPQRAYPDGLSAQRYLEREVWQGAKQDRYPHGLPPSVKKTLKRELRLIRTLDLARYFLTIKEIVDFARNQKPPILCQGRGSAANSAVCYCLGITAVDPAKHQLLFDRFISKERREPPDIDVDFEHERREEVIQHIYETYGRDRAGLCATVIHYRPRMAIREVGKAMGLSEDVTAALARTVWGGWGNKIGEKHATEAGMNVTDPHLRRVLKLTEQMIGMPRHLSQHVGGFILTDQLLTETVPIGNGAMPDRSFIEWDKDDIDDLGIFKVDVLALGMLTCIRKCLDLLRQDYGRELTLATVPREDPAVYDMLCRADSLGVFQVESRAQMNMLPRLRPRRFYDLVIQVAIVRPGPIQGDMVHPYLKRRRAKSKGEGDFQLPGPAPEHGASDELSLILGRTLGVPIFQEQAMKIALDAAKFSPEEANHLRKAMATFRSRGMVHELEDVMVGRMVARGYDPEFAQRCFNQIKGFGEYGFPESHAASFAHLVYVSSWLKCHYPAAFAAALLNSQPMGFYAPAQIVRDVAEHGVAVLPADVNASGWDCTLEDLGSRAPRQARDERAETRRGEKGAGEKDCSRRGAEAQRSCARGEAPFKGNIKSSLKAGLNKGAFGADEHLCASAPLREQLPSLRVSARSSRACRGAREPNLALRLGLRQIDGVPEHVAAKLVAAREAGGRFADVVALRDRAGLSPAMIERLAAADAFSSLALPRRQALWEARSLIGGPALPLFAYAEARDEGAEAVHTQLPAMPLSEEVVADYQTQRLSLKAHPLAFLRESLTTRGFVRACDLRARKFRSMVNVAGVVLIRQRPGSAKGVCFITLEDETGVINLVVWPDLKEKYRKVVMGARLMEVRGRVEYDDEVIHVIAAQMTDATHELHRLSDDLLPTTIARADHCNNPLPSRATPEAAGARGSDPEPFTPPPPGNRECGFPQGHPRDVRIIPRVLPPSRDFH